MSKDGISRTSRKSSSKSQASGGDGVGIADLPLFAKASIVEEVIEEVVEEVVPEAPAAPKHWTVTELTQQIRGLLEPSFRQVWVQGELSNLRPAASGHAYFSLKDEGSCI